MRAARSAVADNGWLPGRWHQGRAKAQPHLRIVRAGRAAFDREARQRICFRRLVCGAVVGAGHQAEIICAQLMDVALVPVAQVLAQPLVVARRGHGRLCHIERKHTPTVGAQIAIFAVGMRAQHVGAATDLEARLHVHFAIGLAFLFVERSHVFAVRIVHQIQPGIGHPLAHGHTTGLRVVSEQRIPSGQSIACRILGGCFVVDDHHAAVGQQECGRRIRPAFVPAGADRRSFVAGRRVLDGAGDAGATRRRYGQGDCGIAYALRR